MSEPHKTSGPSFRELLGASLRVCGIALGLALVAYFLWQGLRLIFPDVAWLQPPS